MEALGFRIRTAAEMVGGLDRLAELVPEMSRRSLSDYANDKSEPRAAILSAIASRTGVSPGRLLSGDGEMMPLRSIRETLDRAILRAAQEGVESTNFSGKLARLPIYDVHASAGWGRAIGAEVQLGVLALDPAFLRARGANPETCSIIWSAGDSMKPLIPDGVPMIVDHSQVDLRNGQIMAINVVDDLLVKRIRRRMDGLIDLQSENPAYATETLGPDVLDQLRIVGRVIHVLLDL